MGRLTYTKEMENQDSHWLQDKEDKEIMKKLFERIINEAKQYSFREYSEIVEENGKAVAKIYTRKDDYDNREYYDHSIKAETCKQLIDILNKRTKGMKPPTNTAKISLIVASSIVVIFLGWFAFDKIGDYIHEKKIERMKEEIYTKDLEIKLIEEYVEDIEELYNDK